MKLNDSVCKNAKPKEKNYKLADGSGLYLDIRVNGSRYWRYKYRIDGKEKLLSLGVYPEISLKKARDKHKIAHELVSEGIDPQKHKREEKRIQTLEGRNTFEKVAREWHEHHKARWKPSNAKRILARLEKDVFPDIGALPINEIRAHELLDVIREIQALGANDIAKRNLQNCGRVFRYGVVTERCERDIAADLKDCLLPTQKKHYPSGSVAR